MLFLSELSVLERIRVKGELAGLAVVVEIVWMLVGLLYFIIIKTIPDIPACCYTLSIRSYTLLYLTQQYMQCNS